MRRIIRWAGWVSLAVASMALVFSLAIVVGRVVAASSVGVSLRNSLAASNDTGSSCPMSRGFAQGPVESAPAAPKESVAGSEKPTPTDEEILADPSLPVPPGRSLSCH
jgi:hypothetical protein